MKLGIVIPFINNNHIHNLLKDIFNNDGRPDSILLIDNRQKSEVQPNEFRESAIEVFRPLEPMPVNEAWKYGINYLAETRKCELISVFNDDLKLEKRFFDKMRILVEDPKNKNYSVFCPETMRMPDFPISPEFFTRQMSKREGWAWTIRAEVAKQMPDIPPELQTFCGDDWIYTWCERFGRPWAKMMGVRLYHYVGASMKTKEGQPARATLDREKSFFASVI